uniref:hypothetical protein n=1 Tax=Microseira wollei TaxID=467598 RepID=UPI001CFCA4C3
MTQTIDDIIARFGQQGWIVQKARENYWVLRPLGLFNYKMFLMAYNPFTNKFQIVKPPNPDSHYDTALKILQGSKGDGGAGGAKGSKGEQRGWGSKGDGGAKGMGERGMKQLSRETFKSHLDLDIYKKAFE